MSQPIPVVRRKLRNGRIIDRRGRGFSVNELRKAGERSSRRGSSGYTLMRGGRAAGGRMSRP